MSGSLIKVASLFCGCGGGDLGILGDFVFNKTHYRRLPFEIVFANDADKKTVSTYNANFQHHAVCEDIRNVEVENIPDHDLLVGGFPCQSFSTVNPSKNPYDDRGNLYKEMAKVLRVKKPLVFIAENVRGFMFLKKGEIFNNACETFKKEGYLLVPELLNACDFGVPQKRERVFIVGTRKDIITKNFQFPDKTNSEEDNTWVPLKDMIDN
ncbi:MAG: DNA cytosine methyltransferase, partial [Mobilitalea sp.]